jgi:hypothetical protein
MKRYHGDLSPLDPSNDELAWERLVSGITRAAAPELERRRWAPGPLLLLSEWTRPTLALAASVAVLAASAFLVPWPDPAAEAMAVGYGAPVLLEEWLVTGEAPSVEELVFAFEGDSR